MSLNDIAERLGFRGAQNVQWWLRNDPSFPKPVYASTRYRIWYWPDIARWAKRVGLAERRRPPHKRAAPT